MYTPNNRRWGGASGRKPQMMQLLRRTQCTHHRGGSVNTGDVLVLQYMYLSTL